MSSAFRRRPVGSWLAMVLGRPANSSSTSNAEASDSESHNSHRSTAAEMPPVADAPVFTDISAQTDIQPSDPLLDRAEKVRSLLRDVVEVVDDQWTPKRIKIREFSHVYQKNVVKPKVPIVREFDPKIVPVPSISKEKTIPARENKRSSEKKANTGEEAVSAKVEKPAAKGKSLFDALPFPATPVQSLVPVPTVSTTPAVSPGPIVPVVQPPQVKPLATEAGNPPAVATASFFVKAATSAESFIEDSGFLGGEDDEEEEDGEKEEEPPSKPFFSSGPGSLFTGAKQVESVSSSSSSVAVSIFGGGNALTAMRSSQGFGGFGSGFFGAATEAKNTSPFGFSSLPSEAPKNPFPPTEAVRGLFQPAEAPKNPFPSTEAPRSLFQPTEAPRSPFQPTESPKNPFPPADAPWSSFQPTEAPKNPFQPTEASKNPFPSTGKLFSFSSPSPGFGAPVLSTFPPSTDSTDKPTRADN